MILPFAISWALLHLFAVYSVLIFGALISMMFGAPFRPTKQKSGVILTDAKGLWSVSTKSLCYKVAHRKTGN
jgi:acyl-coenzyme A synthetase/AMP-(fatty) acid ligase